MPAVWTAVSIAAVALLVLWLLPKLQLRSTRRLLKQTDISLADYLKAENDRRVTVAQILGGLAVLAGLVYSSRTVRLQERGQLTDRINKAVEQLGSSSVPVSLGGIHQLARIADDYDEERYAVLQILTSDLEAQAGLKSDIPLSDCDAARVREYNRLPAPVSQAVITVLAEQVPKFPAPPKALQVDHASLHYVDFSGGRFGTLMLEGDDLTGAQMRSAHFQAGSVFASSLFLYADLTEADLSGVRLHHACMAQTRLRKTVLRRADLTYADFRGVEDLEGTDLSEAKLDYADLRGVDLSRTQGLTAPQLRKAQCDEGTVFPAPLRGSADLPRCAAGAAR